MIGLAYFLFFTVYLLVSIAVIWIAYRFTKYHYERGWIGGWVAAFIMYNLVFWDLIPVLVMHKYYCATQAGFWVYKTPEQWVKEYPEMRGSEWGSTNGRWTTKDRSEIHPDGSRWQRYWYSDHVYWDVFQRP